MSMIRNQCIKCKSVRLETIREINPETSNMNMKVVAKCEDCGVESEYEKMSHYTRRQIDRGLLMV